MVLKYTRMRDKEAKDYLDRVRLHYNGTDSVRQLGSAPGPSAPTDCRALQQGIDFEQVRAFFRRLRMIDDIEMALLLFHRSGGFVTEGKRSRSQRHCLGHQRLCSSVFAADDFARAARTVTGLILGREITTLIFRMFDKDGTWQSLIGCVFTHPDARPYVQPKLQATVGSPTMSFCVS